MPALGPCNTGSLMQLLRHSQRRHMTVGDLVVQQGSRLGHLFLIYSGEILLSAASSTLADDLPGEPPPHASHAASAKGGPAAAGSGAPSAAALGASPAGRGDAVSRHASPTKLDEARRSSPTKLASPTKLDEARRSSPTKLGCGGAPSDANGSARVGGSSASHSASWPPKAHGHDGADGAAASFVRRGFESPAQVR